MIEMNNWISAVKESIANTTFVKITFSKSTDSTSPLQNIYVRLVELKNVPNLSFVYRNKTNDITKNFPLEEAYTELEKIVQTNFSIGTLFTTKKDLLLQISKNKTKAELKTLKASHTNTPESKTHDRQKIKRAEGSMSYLQHLGISDAQGTIIPSMADKYRQINKYLEIIEGLLKSATLPKQVRIVDMGSGKGYLTFALYDFMKNKLGLEVSVTGIELREDLVGYCNHVAQQCGFDSLSFISQRIESYQAESIDILIALHACDTATDDALYKAIVSNSSLIICAPCCHKQIRQQVKGIEQESPLLKYGIFKEREFEMVTDTIRALILEEHQYQTKIFEFISNEHTRKNVMLVGIKNTSTPVKPTSKKEIQLLKETYHIQEHYLEKLLSESV